MLIPTGLTYHAKVSGSILKKIVCEHCGTEYVYALKKTMEGEGRSFLFLDNAGAVERAKESAEEKLEKALRKGTRMAACPTCGRYQKQMIRRRKGYLLGVWALCFVIYFAGSPMVMLLMLHGRRPEPWMLGVWLTLMVLIFLAGPWVALRRYNGKAEERAGKPDADVMRAEELDALVADEKKRTAGEDARA